MAYDGAASNIWQALRRDPLAEHSLIRVAGAQYFDVAGLR